MFKLLLAVSNKVKPESAQLGFKTGPIEILVEITAEVKITTEVTSLTNLCSR